jgi:threonine dehydratase
LDSTISLPASDILPLPSLADVEAAARRIAGMAVETPLLESPALNARLGGRILLKAESLQRTGSFKFRGAYNKLKRLAESASAPGGVVAYSSGNHAQGVAAAAELLGLKAAILMPADAPAIKIANTRAYGAEVALFDRHRDDREAIARALAAERGAVLVPPFDDPDIIAGQGTVGLEIQRQANARGLRLDAALIPASGGGLIAGSALALKSAWPEIAVYVCEPAGHDDIIRSLAAHRRLGAAAPPAPSICDGLLAPLPGEITFRLNDRLLAGGFTVTDDEVLSAMAYAFRVLKLVIEPSGAVPLAALLTGKFDCRDRQVGLVISGGNVDAALFARALQTEG